MKKGNRKQYYRIHRLLAIPMAFFLFFQIISGMIWVLPFPSPVQRLHPRLKPIDFSKVNISISDAINIVKQQNNKDLKIKRVTLQGFRNIVLYEIMDKQGKIYRVNATSGEFLPLNEEVALLLVESQFPRKLPPVSEIKRIEKHDLIYMDGPLPTYRIRFEHKHGFISHVSIPNGEITHSDKYFKIRRWVTLDLHTLAFLSLIWENSAFPRSTIFILGLICMLVVFSGLWLAYLRWKKPNTKATQT
ncbi:MAG: hypothetical protein D6748_03125 [Calditrichaeota bacterium]|nr:MAG: hypothetical protein D6748_03125 [Calditrichota bacterium]